LKSMPLELITVTTLIALLSGCYPHSHDYMLTQGFSGVLLKGGSPMSGVPVSVSHTRGDTGDRVSQAMSICFQALGKRRLGALVVSPTDRQVKYVAVCDWDSKGVEFKQNTAQYPYEWGICARSESSPQ
jgi:hypothetical protein